MTLTMRSWPFALRRGCGKWYSLALVATLIVIAFGASVVLDEPEIMTWSCFYIVLIYGGAVVLASYFANRSRLHPLRPSLSEMRAGRIPVFAELRKYRGLLLLIVVAPFVLGGGVLILDYLLTIIDADYGIVVLVLGSGIFLAVLTAFMYWLFRSEVERARRRDVGAVKPTALYLRSFAGDASLVVGDLPFAPAMRWVERMLGTMFSVERLILRALIAGGLSGVAVGAPGERLPPLGFPRLYFSDQDWQNEVAELISTSKVVIVNCSTTQWVEWELEEVDRQNAKSKLILMAHGRNADERITKLNYGLRALRMDMTLQGEGHAGTIVLTRLDQAVPTIIDAFPDDLFAYLDATTASLYELERRAA